MFVYHCVEASNVNAESEVIDSLKIRHIAVKAGTIEQMSGYIDQLTHLNIDFPDHKADRCIITEKFEKGAKIRFCEQGFAFAYVPKTAFNHLGFVDSTQRMLDMKEAIKAIRIEKVKVADH